MEKRIKIFQSFTLSAIITILFITAITVVSELLPLFKSFLKSTFTHHWIGKSILSILVFLAGALIFLILPVKSNLSRANLLLQGLVIVVVLSFLVILGFFSYEIIFYPLI